MYVRVCVVDIYLLNAPVSLLSSQIPEETQYYANQENNATHPNAA